MSAEPNSVSPVDPVAQGHEAGSAPRSNSSAQFMMSQGVKSFAELEKMAPEVAEAMKKAIADQIISKMQKHQAKMKQINREAQQG